MKKNTGKAKKVYVIQKSRVGFGYQDEYALFIFLKFLLNKNIKAFFIDKGFGEKNFSLDVVVVPRKSENVEVVYEIKTGDRFPKDNKEIGHAFEVFFCYQKQSSKTPEFHLIVSPKLKEKLGRIWSLIEHLHKNKHFPIANRKISPKQIAEELIEKLKLKSIFSNGTKFQEFVQSIEKIEVGDPYAKDSELSALRKLEENVIQKIDRIGEILGIKSPYQMRSDYLMKALLYDIQKCAENGMDFYQIAKKSIIDFFVQRSIISRSLSNDKFDLNVFEQEEKERIRNIFIQTFEDGITESQIHLAKAKGSEGKVIDSLL